MGNRAPQRSSMNSGKTAPATSSAENALVMAQRQNEIKQRRKALTSSTNKGMRMNISTNSLPDLSGYFDDATSNGSAGDIGVPFDTEQLKDMLMSMGVQFNTDGSASGSQIRDVISNDSVIKVFATMQEPDWTLPWQTLDVSDARGSGVVIEGGLILTAAHVIAQWTFLEIQKSTDARKVPTKVVHVCHEADLALLAPMNPDTLKDVKPVKIGAMPKRHDRVFVSGFPIGGEELSVTEGVVSRIEIQPYSHSLRQLLAVTVDAAINSGNSGGPVFDSKGELAGIAFQALEGAENVGHIIPPPIINHFLTGVARDGVNYKGFPELGIAFQNMENPALRKHLKMKDEQTGVLVVKVWYGCSGYDVLMENDVVLAIDGYDVSNTGTIEFDDGVRGELALCIHKHFCGDRVPVKILRDGQVVEVNIELMPLKELTPLSQYIHKPSFFLSAGLLFQPLSTDLLRNYFSGGMMVQAPQELLFLATSPATKTRHEVVVLTRVFRDDINTGYEDLAFSVITHVNGQEVADLKHFVELFEGVKADQLIKLTCSGGGNLILPSTEDELMKESVHRIMKRYNITGDRHLPAGEAQGKKKKHRKSLETANVAK